MTAKCLLREQEWVGKEREREREREGAKEECLLKCRKTFNSTGVCMIKRKLGNEIMEKENASSARKAEQKQTKKE